MGREIRRVPANWEHPKDANGHWQPMFDVSFVDAVSEWKAGYGSWEMGERLKHPRKDGSTYEWWEWNGDPPAREYYRPQWTDAERTHYQLYETVTEGTPLSPPCESPEALARWLSEHGTYWDANDKRTYDSWLRFVKVGWAPSFVLSEAHGFEDGVAAAGRLNP